MKFLGCDMMSGAYGVILLLDSLISSDFVDLFKIDMVDDFSFCLIHVTALSFTVCFPFASGDGLCEGFHNCFGLHSGVLSVDKLIQTTM